MILESTYTRPATPVYLKMSSILWLADWHTIWTAQRIAQSAFSLLCLIQLPISWRSSFICMRRLKLMFSRERSPCSMRSDLNIWFAYLPGNPTTSNQWRLTPPIHPPSSCTYLALSLGSHHGMTTLTVWINALHFHNHSKQFWRRWALKSTFSVVPTP